MCIGSSVAVVFRDSVSHIPGWPPTFLGILRIEPRALCTLGTSTKGAASPVPTADFTNVHLTAEAAAPIAVPSVVGMPQASEFCLCDPGSAGLKGDDLRPSKGLSRRSVVDSGINQPNLRAFPSVSLKKRPGVECLWL